MGTNYCAKKKISYPLTFQINSDKELVSLKEHLQTLQPEIHLGQEKIGYVFLANWNGGRYYSDYISYVNFIRDTDLKIYDEYEVPFSKMDFLKLIVPE
jgi:hypothetical protein